MPLVGFRSFLNVDPNNDLLDQLIKQINVWLMSKELDVDAGSEGQYLLDDNGVISVVRETEGPAQIYRWRRYHPNALPRDVLRTTFTATEHVDGSGWLWTEIEVADGADSAMTVPCMSMPRVLRELLSTVAFRMGRTSIATEPQWVTTQDLPDLMDYLADESRLGGVYVASQGARAVDEFVDWATQVTWKLTGIGSAFLLDDTVTDQFNEMVGEPHSVPAGTIRTYLPGVDLDNPYGSRRHKILGHNWIQERGPRSLAYLLGRSERIRMACAPIPAAAAAVEDVLSAREAALLPRQLQPRPHTVPPTSITTPWVTSVSTPWATREEMRCLQSQAHAAMEAFDRERAELHEQVDALRQEVRVLQQQLCPNPQEWRLRDVNAS